MKAAVGNHKYRILVVDWVKIIDIWFQPQWFLG